MGGNVQSTNDFIVNPLPVISIQPSAIPICLGQYATLSVASSESSPVYQWQSASSVGGDWSYINSPTNPVFFESGFSSLPANTNIYGNASISGGILQLTPAINEQTGGFVIQNTPGANLTAFNANFDYRIWEGTGADGFSLSYAPNIADDAGNGNGGEGSGIIVKGFASVRSITSGNASITTGVVTVTDTNPVTIEYVVTNSNLYDNTTDATGTSANFKQTVSIANGVTSLGIASNPAAPGVYTDDTDVARPATTSIGFN